MRYSKLDLLEKRKDAKTILGELGNGDSPDASINAGRNILHACKKYGVSVRDYLNLTIEPIEDFSGYEVALQELNLPIRQDYANGLLLEAATDTFQTRPGTKVLFKEVVDDILRWKTRINNWESADLMVANSRTIDGVEMTQKVTLEDTEDDRKSRYVPEGGRIPVRSIKAGETSVKIWKHGSAIRTTYEFQRNTRLDAVTPYLARVARELELSKASQAVSVLQNGDGNSNAAHTIDQSAVQNVDGAPSATNNQIQWHRFFRWLMDRATAGVPIDTIVMNYNAYYQWTILFSGSGNTPTSAAEQLTKAGIEINRNPIFDQVITPVLSTAAPAHKLIGFSKADTLEELVQVDSNIEEEERNILNQTITMTKTENTGYRLIFDDTRSVYDFGA